MGEAVGENMVDVGKWQYTEFIRGNDRCKHKNEFVNYNAIMVFRYSNERNKK